MIYKKFNNNIPLYGVSIIPFDLVGHYHDNTSWASYSLRRLCVGAYKPGNGPENPGGFNAILTRNGFTGAPDGCSEVVRFDSEKDAQKWIDRHAREVIKEGKARCVQQFHIYKARGEKECIPCPLYDDPDLECWVRDVKLKQLVPNKRKKLFEEYPEFFNLEKKEFVPDDFQYTNEASLERWRSQRDDATREKYKGRGLFF